MNIYRKNSHDRQMLCSSFRISEQTEFPILRGADYPENKLPNESPGSVLKVTAWVASAEMAS